MKFLHSPISLLPLLIALCSISAALGYSSSALKITTVLPSTSWSYLKTAASLSLIAPTSAAAASSRQMSVMVGICVADLVAIVFMTSSYVSARGTLHVFSSKVTMAVVCAVITLLVAVVSGCYASVRKGFCFHAVIYKRGVVLVDQQVRRRFLIL
jgi:hypothetical protein